MDIANACVPSSNCSRLLFGSINLERDIQLCIIGIEVHNYIVDDAG